MKAKKAHLISSEEDLTGERSVLFWAYLFDSAGSLPLERRRQPTDKGKGSEVKCLYSETVCEDVLHLNIL